MRSQRPLVSCAARVITGGLLLIGLAVPGRSAGASPPPEEFPSAVVPAGAVAPPPGPHGIDPPVPSVALRVRVPAEAPVGKELTYRITAENISRVSAHHVTVRVPVPTGARFVRATPEPTEKEPVLAWKLGTLAGCASKDITLVLQPTGEGEVTCCARVQFEHGQCVRTRIGKPAVPPRREPAVPAGQPELQLRKAGPGEAARNDLLTYRLEVTNIGRGTARNVVLEDALPKGLEFSSGKPAPAGDKLLRWDLGDLPPGRSRVVELQAIPGETGTLQSKVVVRADGGLRRETTHSLRVGEPVLTVRKTGPKVRLVGRSALYQITVTNTGTLAATNVQVADDLAKVLPYIAFVGATEGGRLDGDTVRWNLGTLAPGARRRVDVIVRAKQAGTFEKYVCTVTADRGLLEQSWVGTDFKVGSGLAVEIDKAADPMRVGQETLWTVRLLNLGKAAEKNVDMTVTMPEGVTVLEVRLDKGPGRPGPAGRTIKLPRKPNVPAGMEWAAVLRVKCEKQGELPLLVDAVSESTGPDRPVKAEETVTVEK